MINWLDFKSIKRTVTLESVLRHYQVKLRRSGKDQYRGCCPIHRGDGRDAFHVNLARNVFHCFACGAGGTVLDFVAAMEGCSLFDAAQRLQSMTGSSTPLTLTPNRKELVTERRKVSSPLNFKLTGIECAHPYLAGRGITEKTAVEFGVGQPRDPSRAARLWTAAVRGCRAHVRACATTGRQVVHRRSPGQARPRPHGADADLGQGGDRRVDYGRRRQRGQRLPPGQPSRPATRSSP